LKNRHYIIKTFVQFYKNLYVKGLKFSKKRSETSNFLFDHTAKNVIVTKNNLKNPGIWMHDLLVFAFSFETDP